MAIDAIERVLNREIVRPRRLENVFIATRGEIAASMVETIVNRNKDRSLEEQTHFVVPMTFSDGNPIAARMVDAHPDIGTKIEIGGYSADENYLDEDLIITTALGNGCDSIFLGYGFLSEKAEFVKRCEQAGLQVIGATSKAIEATGNKIEARKHALKVRVDGFERVPVIPGTEDLERIEDAIAAVNDPDKKIGYPAVLKDPDTGGGDGVIFVNNQQELEQGYAKLKQNPNNKQIFLEKYIKNAVHIEIQIVADRFNTVVSLGERDCTVQRKGQKIIEESPTPRVRPHVVKQYEAFAKAMAKSIHYVGAGTWEFIVDMDNLDENGDPKGYFMEVNPRVQVEREVTHMRTGIDILDTMITIAEGRRLPFTQADIQPSGVVLQGRMYAEDPYNAYQQGEGYASVLRYPVGRDELVRAAIEEGDELTLEYDPTILLRLARDPVREGARLKLLRGLSATELVGLVSNRTLLTEILASREFEEAKGINTVWVDSWGPRRFNQQAFDLNEFIGAGVFRTFEPSILFDWTKLPQDEVVLKKRKDKDGKDVLVPVSYFQEMADLLRKHGTTKASQFGIHELKGLRYVLYTLNYGIRAGTLGVQEGIDFREACRLAHVTGLPLGSVVSTAGADQCQNQLALFSMGASEDALDEFGVDYLFNIDTGFVFGGGPASMLRQATFKIATKGRSHIGLAGPRATLLTIDPEWKGGTVDETYQALQEALGVTPHEPATLFEDRMEHILVNNLSEAADKAAHLLHSCKTGQMIVDPNYVYAPQEAIAYSHPGLAIRFDQPGQFTRSSWGSFGARLWHKFRSSSSLPKVELVGQNLTNHQREIILDQPERPTAADLIDTKSGLFKDAVFLSTPPEHTVEKIGNFKTEVEQYPPIIAAKVRFEKASLDNSGNPIAVNEDIFVIAQQVQRVIENGKLFRRYRAQRPCDWEYVLDMLSYAKRRAYPVLTMVDTQGASGAPQDERGNQLQRISDVINETNKYPYYLIALLLGRNGSGGGHALFRKFNNAAVLEHTISSVAEWIFKFGIRRGIWINAGSTKEELEEFIAYKNQHEDANAFGMVKMRLADSMIAEGPAANPDDPNSLPGAHNDPRIIVEGMSNWMVSTLHQGLVLPAGEAGVIPDRRQRIRDVYDLFTIPNPAFASNPIVF